MNIPSTEQLLLKLSQINDSITKEKNPKRDVGLLSGKMGQALFHFRYAKFKENPSLRVHGEELLHQIALEIDKGFNLPTFCSGIFGVALGFELLEETDLVNLNVDSFFDEFDSFVEEALNHHFEVNNYDFLHGYIGLGMYLLKRYENTKSDKSKILYAEKLTRIIEQLKSSAIAYKGMFYWVSKLDKDQGFQTINLGLSHGMASIVNFLSRLASYSDFMIEAHTLLNKAIPLILSSQSKLQNTNSLFPNGILLDDKTKKPASRLAWCYGDLGIGLSLWHAANALDNDNLLKKATSILKHSSHRRDLKNTIVKDAGICHGAMGNMLIFDYLYKEIQIDYLKKAADFWMAKSMEMAIHPEGHAGFMSRRNRNNEWVWEKETDLLDGAAGAGLAIMSYLSPKPLIWSQCLMIA